MPFDNLPLHDFTISRRHEFAPFDPLNGAGRACVQTRQTFGTQHLIDGCHTLAFIQADRTGRTGVYTRCTSRACGLIYVQQIIHLPSP